MEAHWIVTLAVILPFWFLQNVIHELSHGLTLKLGWKWNFSIYPLPSMKLGRFTWAHVKYERTEESKEVDKEGWALIRIMPKLVNIVFMLLASVLAAGISNNVVTMILLVFAWTNFIDYFVGMLSAIRLSGLNGGQSTDLLKFKRDLDIPDRTLQIGAVVSTIVLAVPVIASTLLQLLS